LFGISVVHGLIFNIQKFSLHDGPGIRTTVFFKGCPLDCWWCNNVESQGFGREPMFRADLCGGCGSCVAACLQQAIRVVGGLAVTDPATCLSCGRCSVFCPANGRSICGSEMSVAEVVAEVVKDRVFYDQSGGGVTFSGGEALVQIDFLVEALTACKAKGLHTAVDTSGAVPWEYFERILPLTDLFLYDLKLMDDAAHRWYTGVSNRLILENLERLSAATEGLWIRLPVVPTVNDDSANIRRTIAFLQTIRFRQLNLLPYHDLGRGKAAQLGRPYRLEGVKAPDAGAMESLQREFAAAGFKTVIGG
jgi:pyruvate formate lyase activating enzyme